MRGVGNDVFVYSSITGTQTTIMASKRNISCILFNKLSIVSLRNVIAIYKSQYCSLLSLSLPPLPNNSVILNKRNAGRVNTAMFPDALRDYSPNAPDVCASYATRTSQR